MRSSGLDLLWGVGSLNVYLEVGGRRRGVVMVLLVGHVNLRISRDTFISQSKTQRRSYLIQV